MTGHALRHGKAADAVAIAALSVQVFLDTYAPDGVRPDLARESFAVYSTGAFEDRLVEPGRCFILAERDAGLIGYAEVLLHPVPAPAGDVVGAELVRLYVQPQAQGQGLGRSLLQAAEREAVDADLAALWLTAWDGNARAIAFYGAMDYEDVGATTYTFEGNTYGNRVMAQRLERAASRGR